MFPSEKAYTAIFAGKGKTTYVLWSDSPKDIEITFPECKAVIYDLQGNIIEALPSGGLKLIAATTSPIFIEVET